MASLHRSFVDGIEDHRDNVNAPLVSREGQLDVARLRDDVIGAYHIFQGPFGRLRMVYADWIASGRALKSVEHFIQHKVLPFYANTHTSSSLSGLQSSCFRLEARQIVQQAVNGNNVKDVVLFTGYGATAAVNKLVGIMGLKTTLKEGERRPLVLIGPWEHHSNILPWRESCADIIEIRENELGSGVCMDHLKNVLVENCKTRPLIIGAFSAASNVTGLLADVHAITALLHRHGALACWDYACAAPYCKIDMNPVLPGDHPDHGYVAPDAVFLSMHKFVGGVNTPGVMIVKKKLLGNAVPESVGGGTVFFVQSEGHRYLANREEREEAGTADLVGIVRASLCFQLKNRVGVSRILELEKKWCALVSQELESHPNMALLGPSFSGSGPRIPIVSFLVRHGSMFLHYQFVSSVLNDVFGIQSRGGCMCAGPYAQRLLGMSEEVTSRFDAELVEHAKHSEYIRPGFSRLSLAYFVSDEEAEYVIKAIKAVATHGWRLLPLYRFNSRSGEWKHKSRFTKFPERVWLDDMNIPFSNADDKDDASSKVDFQVLYEQGLNVLTGPINAEPLGDQTELFTESSGPLRWFVLPSEVQSETTQLEQPETSSKPEKRPLAVFDPVSYWKSIAGSIAESVDTEVSSKKPRIEETICENGACFTRRTTNKFPLRTSAVIHSETTSVVVPEPDKKQEEEPQAIIVAEKPAVLRPKPPKSILRWVGKAIAEWDMIQDGDRLLLGLSGGKDSLCLLHVLLDLQRRAPVKFELAACTIDPMTEAFDPSPLIPYMESLGVKYHFIQTPIFDKAKSGSLQGTSICSFCARMKRGALYSCARTHGYNTLVLAQHLDDLAETTVMGMFYNGQVRTMMANYREGSEQDGIRVIRPLVYCREREMKEFSYKVKLPVINENCPACFEAPQERRRVKKLLAKEESRQPQLFNNMRRALTPLMNCDILDGLKQELAFRESKGKGKPDKNPPRHEEVPLD